LLSVATMLGLGMRTLQRRLSEEGVTYARVVARARFNLAQWLLDDPACKIIEVALDLGYSDQAHFSRAFARWTGLAPREFQRIRASGGRGGAPRFPVGGKPSPFLGGRGEIESIACSRLPPPSCCLRARRRPSRSPRAA